MKSQAVLSLLAAGALIVSFQNCESSGAGGAASSGSNSNGAAATSPTPAPSATPLPVVDLDCRDASGNIHANGSTWSESLAPNHATICPGTVENYILRQESLSYSCVSAIIITTGDSIEPLNAPMSCALPGLAVSVSPINPLIGSNSTLSISSQNVSSVAMSCVETDSGTVFGSQSVAVGAASVAVPIQADATCHVVSTAADGSTISAEVGVDVNCGNKIKVGGHCEDFSCKTLVALQPLPNGTLQVPARTVEGLCYAVHMADAIANSSSKLTTTIDSQVISRNHDLTGYTANDTHNPYLMAQAVQNFVIAGPRTIKVAGSGDSLSPILVDNFVLSGVYPASVSSPSNPNASLYKAAGSSDATIGATGGVSLNGSIVPLAVFASGGTSTLAPLDITDDVAPNIVYTLDVRAEDCGGSRQLSDLYLVFQ